MPRVSQVIIFFVLLLALGLGGSPCAAQAPNPECSIPGVPPVIELQCCLIIWFGDALAGDPNAFNDTWVPCVEGLPPAQMPAPPNPNPPPPSACIQPEIATATARAISPMDQGSCGITFVDPVPDLQAGNKITSDPYMLATQGKHVSAVAADGAARVIIRIPANRLGRSCN